VLQALAQVRVRKPSHGPHLRSGMSSSRAPVTVPKSPLSPSDKL